MATTDGGPAFPQPFGGAHNAAADAYGYGGMTLLDWFAGQALAGLIAGEREGNWWPNCAPDPKMAVAKEAYRRASAMLAERSQLYESE